MLDKVWTSTEEVVRERLSSPALVPFVISWIGWNYKFLVVLFSSVGVPRVFELIAQLYPSGVHYLFPGFLFPLFTAAFLVFVIPHLEHWILERTLGTQRKILDLRRDHTNATKLTLAESRALRADMAKQEADHKRQMQAQANVIAAFQHQQNSDRAAIAALSAREDADPFALNESERLSLGQFLGASAPGEPVKLSALKEDAASHVQKLLHLGLIRETLRGVQGDDRAFTLTRAGAVSLHGKGLSTPDASATAYQSEEMDEQKARVLATIGGTDAAATRNALLEELDIGPAVLDRHLSDLLAAGYVLEQDGLDGNVVLGLTRKARDLLLRKV